MKILKAKELIENNIHTNIGVAGNTTVVFTEIALTAVNLAREEGREAMKKGAIEVLSSVLENWVHGGDADCIIAEFEEKLSN